MKHLNITIKGSTGARKTTLLNELKTSLVNKGFICTTKDVASPEQTIRPHVHTPIIGTATVVVKVST